MRKAGGRDGESTLQHRCHSGNSTLPTFLARYGTQHKLSESRLTGKGNLAHFYRPHNQPPRHWHPCEIAMHHVVTPNYFCPGDLEQGWAFEGNQITMPHALLMLSNAINCLPTRAPTVSIAEVMQQMWDSKLQASTVELKVWPHACALVQERDNRYDDPFPQHYAQLMEVTAQATFPSDFQWHPRHGLSSLLITPRQLTEGPEVSQVTEVEHSPSLSPTNGFVPVQLGVYSAHQRTFKFWMDADIPIDNVADVWGKHCVAKWVDTEVVAEHGYVCEIYPSERAWNTKLPNGILQSSYTKSRSR